MVIEQQNRPRGNKISQDPLLCKKKQNSQGQSILNDFILVLCCIAALSVWDRTEESGKKTESFTKVI